MSKQVQVQASIRYTSMSYYIYSDVEVFSVRTLKASFILASLKASRKFSAAC